MDSNLKNNYHIVLLFFIISIAMTLLFYFLPIGSPWQKVNLTKIYLADNITPAHLKIIDNFNKRYAGKIKVIPVDLPFSKFNTNERKELLARTLRNQNSRIDIFAVDQIWMARFSKWAEPLSRYFSKEELSKILPQALKTCYNGNILVAIPLHIDIGVMYYRKDFIAQLPNPDLLQQKLKNSITWKEFIGLKKYSPDSPLYLFQGDNYEGLLVHVLEIVAGLGGGSLITDGKINIQTPEFRKGVRFLVDLIHKYRVSPIEVTRFNEQASYRYAFKNNIPFFRGWPSLLREIDSIPEGAAIKDQLGVAALPHFKGFPAVSEIGGWNLMIADHSNNKTQASLFLKYVLSTEGQKILMETGGYLPVKKEIYTDEASLKINPYLNLLKTLMEKGVYRPVHKDYTKISAIITPWLHKALTGEITVEKALSMAQKEVDEWTAGQNYN
ncbi:MAG: extracellular solute-binding protein [Calditrichaeota bacterium]|nr:extracellular solute-binding protein [Calditrichota bacterium]